ncbi:MAG: glutathione peroxidase [Myxococcales bacterium]|nr:glutathione peroxidase [Myxococcales bacterium]MCB9643477.1 glutathione peroxidase [Myxococcales bacterium]
MTSVYDFTVRSIDGEELPLAQFQGKVLLVVNVASRCGLTPHYKGLQALYSKYKEQGLVVLGFPCNQFGAQEPGPEEEIKAFCALNYKVDFPMFSKIEVNGEGRHPLYAYLTSQQTKPDGTGDITWNFAKFLIGKDGKVLARFSPTTPPEDPQIVQALESALG